MIQPTFKLTDVKINAKTVAMSVKRASVAPEMKAGFLVERDAKASMKRGGAYKAAQGTRKGKTARSGKPSAPGEPPNVQSGALRSSITTAKDGWSVIVGPTVLYGKEHEQPGNIGEWAEFSGRKYPKRPFMRPALLRMARKFAKLWRSLRLR